MRGKGIFSEKIRIWMREEEVRHSPSDQRVPQPPAACTAMIVRVYVTYIYIYIYTCVCIYIYIYTCIHISLSLSLSIHIYIYIHNTWHFLIYNYHNIWHSVITVAMRRRRRRRWGIAPPTRGALSHTRHNRPPSEIDGGAVFGCFYRLRREIPISQNWLKG